jgi:Tfp pilus assembly protein PilN
MLRDIYPPYDPDDAALLRSETAAVCRELEQDIDRLENDQTAFEDVDRLYRQVHQLKAAALATAMLHHVPDNDPRLMMITKSGNVQTFKSDDLTTIACSLIEEAAATQLATIVQMLRQLTTYLPNPV